MTHAPLDTHRAERGFSLIEVIIALTILSIVLSGAAMAMVSSDSAEIQSKTVADSHAMAEKAMERLRSDLTARSGCDSGGWIDAARDGKASTAPADFAPCLVNYNDMRDAKGRNYSISLVIQPRDKTDDGTGSADTDGDLRDAYDVTTTVDLATDSKAGREDMEPVELGGTVDWKGGSADDASITVEACAIDRPDRALMAGGCTTTDASRRPITLTIDVKKVNEQTGALTDAGTITSGALAATIEPGAYRFEAPETVTEGGSTFKLMKIDPANIRATGSSNYRVQATYVRNALTTRVCTQINNWTPSYDDGYEVLETNIHYRRTNQPGYRSNRITLNADRSWNCTATGHILHDPVANTPTNLYRGLYDLEVEQVKRRVPEHVWGLRLTEARMNCSLSNWNQGMGGTALIDRDPDSEFERPGSGPSAFRSSWFARMAITATSGTQTLCLRFNSKQLEREECAPNPDGSTNTYSGCEYQGTECALPSGTVDDDSDCFNGAEVCTANCDGAETPQGTVDVSKTYTTFNSWGTAGPTDNTMACRASTGYNWPGTRFLSTGYTTLSPMDPNGNGIRDDGVELSHDWIGGNYGAIPNYYGPEYTEADGRVAASGAHKYTVYGVHDDYDTYSLPDNPVAYCRSAYFAPGRLIFESGTYDFKFYECIQVTINGRSVRGRILDTTGAYNDNMQLSLGAAMALFPEADHLRYNWNYMTTGPGSYRDAAGETINWPEAQVRRVSGDPVCDSGLAGNPQMSHVDPIITQIWNKPVDDPEIYALDPPPTTTNLGRDRLGV